MKNLLAFLAFGLLTFISCQTDTKNTASDNNSAKATASVPTTVPVATPAPVAPSPKKDITETDEAPAVPPEPATAKKSVKITTAKSENAPTKITETDKIKEAITESKNDADAKIAAEKEKLAAEVARIEAEQIKKAEEKAAKIKAAAEEKINNTKNNIKKNVDGVKDDIKKTVKEATFSHQIFDDLLRKHVSSTGKVNYTGFKQDQAKLKSYLTQLEAQAVESSWSKDKKLAYWINAYNAYTIDMIVRNYPLKSITDLEGGKPWDKKFIKLNGKTLSLNNIENDIIRPTFKDARIHFAVNCAAKSCPPLMNKAWTETNLQSELDKRTRSFINSNTYNTINSGSAKISKIFEWYAEDFGNLNDYLAKYNSEVSSSTKISYIDYNWALNN